MPKCRYRFIIDGRDDIQYEEITGTVYSSLVLDVIHRPDESYGSKKSHPEILRATNTLDAYMADRLIACLARAFDYAVPKSMGIQFNKDERRASFVRNSVHPVSVQRSLPMRSRLAHNVLFQIWNLNEYQDFMFRTSESNAESLLKLMAKLYDWDLTG